MRLWVPSSGHKTSVDAKVQKGGLFWTFSVCPSRPNLLHPAQVLEGSSVWTASMSFLPSAYMLDSANERQNREKSGRVTIGPVLPWLLRGRSWLYLFSTRWPSSAVIPPSCPFRSRCGHFLPFSFSSSWLKPTLAGFPNSALIFVNNAFY